jgi:hypothetical protein
MTPKFSAKVSMKLQAFQAYAEGHAFTSCRLVHYIGVDKVMAEQALVDVDALLREAGFDDVA